MGYRTEWQNYAHVHLTQYVQSRQADFGTRMSALRSAYATPLVFFRFVAFFKACRAQHKWKLLAVGLHEQIFGQSIQNAHRARNDVVACIAILNHLTTGKWTFQGPMYPTYCTALRTIRWIGQKAEEILFNCNIRSVEKLYTFLLKEARLHYVQQGLDFSASVQTTLFSCLGEKLPPDNIRNIAAVLASAKKCVYCHTFMEPVGLRCDSPNLK